MRPTTNICWIGLERNHVRGRACVGSSVNAVERREKKTKGFKNLHPKARTRITSKGFRTFTPESGPDCLIYTEFARRRQEDEEADKKVTPSTWSKLFLRGLRFLMSQVPLYDPPRTTTDLK